MRRTGLVLTATAVLLLASPVRGAAPASGPRSTSEPPGAVLQLDGRVLELVGPAHDGSTSRCGTSLNALLAAAEDPSFNRLPTGTRRAVLDLLVACQKGKRAAAPVVALIRRLEPLTATPKVIADANEILMDDAYRRDQPEAVRRLIRVIDADPDRVGRWWPRYLNPLVYSDAVVADAALSLALFERLTSIAWTDSSSQFEAATSWPVAYARLLLDRGDVVGADRALAPVLNADSLMEVAESRRFEALWPKFEADGRFDWRGVAEASLAINAARLAASPDHLDIVDDHLRILTRLGRYVEAVRLGQSYRGRLKAGETFAGSNRGADWMLSKLAGALLALNRTDEAEAVSLEAIAADRVDGVPINQSLVWASRLDDMGRPADALAMLDSIGPDGASAYGQLWIDAERACALSQMDDPRASALLDTLPAKWADNPAAVTGAMICGNRLDEAAGIFIRRLQDSRFRDDALASARRMDPSPGSSAWKRLYEDRRESIFARPAVAAAISAVGRRIQVPLART